MSKEEANARRKRVAKDVGSIMNAWAQDVCMVCNVRCVVCRGVTVAEGRSGTCRVFRDAVTFWQADRDHDGSSGSVPLCAAAVD
jgi:hypothetical protein